MKNRIFISLLAVLSLSLFLAFLYGCTGATSAGPWIYCGNSNSSTILVINGTTNTSTELINLVDYMPYHMAASPDGKKIYIANLSDNIQVLDTATNTTLEDISVPNSNHSHGMAVSGDGAYLYLTSGTSPSFIKVYLNAGNTYESVALLGLASKIALSADSTKAYVCVNGTSTYNISATLASLEVINLQTMTKEASVDVINHPWDIAIKGNYAYLALSSLVQCVARVDLSDYSVETIEHSPVSFTGIVSIPGTNKLYISNAMSPYEIYILDTTKFPTPETTTITSTEMYAPRYMAATAKYAYAIDGLEYHNKIAVIDTANDEIVKFIYGHNGAINNNNPVIIYK